MKLEIRKAQRKKAKIKLGLSGASGFGKTYSSILLAKGLIGDLSKVAIIDTENGSADLYAHLGNYNVITLEAPYSPARYVEAIHACEKAGMELIIIDSITHEWDGSGGCLEMVDQVTKSSGNKNSYIAWGKITPLHKSFVDTILQSKCHIFTTVRRKQDYDMNKNEKGKLQVQKVGTKEITREGFEYELTVNLEFTNDAHYCKASKDRTGLFSSDMPFIITEETGKVLKKWCEGEKVKMIDEKKRKEAFACWGELAKILRYDTEKSTTQRKNALKYYYEKDSLKDLEYSEALDFIEKIRDKIKERDKNATEFANDLMPKIQEIQQAENVKGLKEDLEKENATNK